VRAPQSAFDASAILKRLAAEMHGGALHCSNARYRHLLIMRWRACSVRKQSDSLYTRTLKKLARAAIVKNCGDEAEAGYHFDDDKMWSSHLSSAGAYDTHEPAPSRLTCFARGGSGWSSAPVLWFRPQGATCMQPRCRRRILSYLDMDASPTGTLRVEIWGLMGC